MFELPPRDRAGAHQAEGLLAGLRDLEGVWGSFAVSLAGDLLVWDVPRPITEDVLDAVAPRLALLREAFANGGKEKLEADVITLRFAQHRLYVGAASFGLVCAITAPTINSAALRMALNVTTRRLTRMFESTGPADPRNH